jgi:cyclopropane-fatty-acyl-phospholipid synthase
LRSGDHVLDIGGGWGGLKRFCQERDVRVTSLTLSEDSARFIREHAGGEVVVQDLLEHRVREPYDHVVILGVIEHIPTYRRFCERVWDVLKPGGRLYLDASATREKYASSAFTRRYTWNGVHSCLCLQDLVRELLFHGFEISSLHGGTDDYEWTMRGWAENLENAQTFLCSRWSESRYRASRIFLWGGAHAFRTRRLQSYTVVANRGRQPGPRPGLLRRAGHMLGAVR